MAALKLAGVTIATHPYFHVRWILIQTGFILSQFSLLLHDEFLQLIIHLY